MKYSLKVGHEFYYIHENLYLVGSIFWTSALAKQEWAFYSYKLTFYSYTHGDNSHIQHRDVIMHAYHK